MQNKKFDIFFSHAWVDKPLLSYVYRCLVSLGYRVWYDQYDMGYDLKVSMEQGIANSKVVIACVNNTYQSRPNCMFELKETVTKFPKKPLIALILEANMGNSWNAEIRQILDFRNKMYCDISSVASDSFWNNNVDNDEPSNELLGRLKKILNPLIKTLSDVECHPSLSPSSI